MKISNEFRLDMEIGLKIAQTWHKYLIDRQINGQIVNGLEYRVLQIMINILKQYISIKW